VTSRGSLGDNERTWSDAKRAGLFRGLWPGQVLLSRGLNDPSTKTFKASMRVFMGIFVVMHMVLLGLLASSAIREFGDTLPDNRPAGATQLDGVYYTTLGTGYCRDDSMQRPDCYWRALDTVAQGASPARQSQGRSPVARTASLQKKPKPLHSLRKGHAKADGMLYYHPAMVPQHASSRRSMFLSVSTNASVTQTPAPAVDESLPEWIMPQERKVFAERQIEFCGKECNSNKQCIGFSLDPEYCTVYNSQYVKAPEGWENSAEVETRSSRVRRNSFIVQGSKFELATCWSRANTKGSPQDIVGAIVCSGHILVVLFILFSTLRHTHIGIQDLKCW